MILGRFATDEAKTQLRHELGLDRPVPVQYVNWLGDFVRGDWGTSPSMDTVVRPVVFERLRNSLMLALVAFAIYVPLGILLGLIAALRKNTWVDNLISVGSLAFIGLPEFVSGTDPHRDLLDPARLVPVAVGDRPELDLRRGLPVPDPAGDHRGADEPRLRRAHDALEHRRRAADGLRAHRQPQGPAAAPGALHARAAQLAAADHHRGRHRHRLAHRRPDHHRVGVLATRASAACCCFAIQRRDLLLIQATALLIVIIYVVANLVADVLYAVLNPRIRYT